MIFGDPVAMEFWPAIKSRAEIVKSIEWIRQGYREQGYGLWAVELKETGDCEGGGDPPGRPHRVETPAADEPAARPYQQTIDFVGRVGLIRQEQGLEVAYALMPRHWHRGYATEAARACRDWAFTHLDCDHVISLVHPRVGQEEDPLAETAGEVVDIVGDVVCAGKFVGRHEPAQVSRGDRETAQSRIEAEPEVFLEEINAESRVPGHGNEAGWPVAKRFTTRAPANSISPWKPGMSLPSTDCAFLRASWIVSTHAPNNFASHVPFPRGWSLPHWSGNPSCTSPMSRPPWRTYSSHAWSNFTEPARFCGEDGLGIPTAQQHQLRLLVRLPDFRPVTADGARNLAGLLGPLTDLAAERDQPVLAGLGATGPAPLVSSSTPLRPSTALRVETGLAKPSH